MTDSQIKTAAERYWRERFYASDPENRERRESVTVRLPSPVFRSYVEYINDPVPARLACPTARVQMSRDGLAEKVIR